MDFTNIEPLKSTYKLLDELEYKGTPTHISPRTLHGLRTATLYTQKNQQNSHAYRRTIIPRTDHHGDPPAINLKPPGVGLHNLIEEELKSNFSMVDLNYIQMNLEKALVEGLEIVEAFEMEVTVY